MQQARFLPPPAAYVSADYVMVSFRLRLRDCLDCCSDGIRTNCARARHRKRMSRVGGILTYTLPKHCGFEREPVKADHQRLVRRSLTEDIHEFANLFFSLSCDHIGLSTLVFVFNFFMLPLAHAVPLGERTIFSSASPKVAQNGMLLKELAFRSCTVIDLIFDSIPWRLPC